MSVPGNSRRLSLSSLDSLNSTTKPPSRETAPPDITDNGPRQDAGIRERSRGQGGGAADSQSSATGNADIDQDKTSPSQHKKSTPPKPVAERKSPQMRGRSASQPLMIVLPADTEKIPDIAEKKQKKNQQSILSSPTSPRSPRLLKSATKTDSTREPITPKAAETTADNAPALPSKGKLPQHSEPSLHAGGSNAAIGSRSRHRAIEALVELIVADRIKPALANAKSSASGVAIDTLTPALRKLVSDHKEPTITIDKLVLALFAKGLEDSASGQRARAEFVRFKGKSPELTEAMESGNQQTMEEARRIILSFGASIAAALLYPPPHGNLPELPQELLHFLYALDQRLLALLLKDQRHGPHSGKAIDQLRRQQMTTILIDRCLIPYVMEAFYLGSGGTSAHLLASHATHALHEAAKYSLRNLLAESLQQAPSALARQFQHHRISELKVNAKKDKAPARSSATITTTVSSATSAELMATSSMKELEHRKQWLADRVRALRREIPDLPAEVLDIIKSSNKALLWKVFPMEDGFILERWSQIIADELPHSPIPATLRVMHSEHLSRIREIVDIESTLLDADLSLVAQAFSTGSLPSQKARPLSGWITEFPSDAALTSVSNDVSTTTSTTAMTVTTTTTSTSAISRTTTTTVATSASEPVASQDKTMQRTSAPGRLSGSPGTIPLLNLSALQNTQGSPYKPPRASLSTPAIIPPLPSPPESPPLSPTATPPISPSNEPSRLAQQLRDSGESSTTIIMRRKLVGRHTRTGSQPPLPLRESPRSKVMKPVADDQMPVLRSFATVLIAALRGIAKDGKLSRSMIASLARTDIRIPVGSLPGSLQMPAQTVSSPRVSSGSSQAGDSTVSHSSLLKQLTAESLKVSHAGSTLLALKTAAMKNQKAEQLDLVSWAAMSNKDELKTATIDAMRDAATGTARISLGKPPSLATCALPSDLLAVWKEADRLLCDWASENPDLTLDDISNARSALGFDLIVTRSIIPLIAGRPEEAHLVIPGWFASAVLDAHRIAWPSFLADFVKVVNAERAATLTDEKAGKSSKALG